MYLCSSISASDILRQAKKCQTVLTIAIRQTRWRRCAIMSALCSAKRGQISHQASTFVNKLRYYHHYFSIHTLCDFFFFVRWCDMRICNVKYVPWLDKGWNTPLETFWGQSVHLVRFVGYVGGLKNIPLQIVHRKTFWERCSPVCDVISVILSGEDLSGEVTHS